MAAMRADGRSIIACLERDGRLAPKWNVDEAADLFWSLLSILVAALHRRLGEPYHQPWPLPRTICALDADDAPACLRGASQVKDLPLRRGNGADELPPAAYVLRESPVPPNLARCAARRSSQFASSAGIHRADNSVIVQILCILRTGELVRFAAPPSIAEETAVNGA
jgi:hypothetical protein